MLHIAYPSLTREGDVYVVGPVSEGPGEGYLWHYWIPWMAMLDRDHLRLRRLEQVLDDGCPFVFPLELRWEFIDWFARGLSTDFLTPHVPPAVLTAARAGKAVILLFFGHEARLLSFTDTARQTKQPFRAGYLAPIARKARAAKAAILRHLGIRASSASGSGAESGEQQSAYDLIFGFVRRHKLPRGAVWFISGNLEGRPEYESWNRRRLRGNAEQNPFEARFVEPFSYLAKMACRDRERGFDLTVNWVATKNGEGLFLHQSTRLVPKQLAQNIRADPERPRGIDGVPSKLFLCMNRVTRQHRRTIVCHLLRRGFLDRSLVSFRDDNPDQTLFEELEIETAWRELKKRLPLTIDLDLPLEFESYFQSNSAAVNAGEFWPYRDTSFSIVTETHFGNDTLFVSEKLWKPILNGQPFVVAGTPGTLAYLRSLGFRTFTPMIDERYDTLTDDAQRMEAILDTIDALGALNDDERAVMLERMQPILAHNASHLRQLKSPMAKVFSDIDAKLTAAGTSRPEDRERSDVDRSA